MQLVGGIQFDLRGAPDDRRAFLRRLQDQLLGEERVEADSDPEEPVTVLATVWVTPFDADDDQALAEVVGRVMDAVTEADPSGVLTRSNLGGMNVELLPA